MHSSQFPYFSLEDKAPLPGEENDRVPSVGPRVEYGRDILVGHNHEKPKV